MADSRFHIAFADPAAQEHLGLLLIESGSGIGFSKRLVNPYAAKSGSGYSQDADLTEWEMVSQRDWRGGRGYEEWKGASRGFLDAWNVETRIEGQATLGPLPQQQVATAVARYEPGSTASFGVGWPRPVAEWPVGTQDEYIRSVGAMRPGQSFRVFPWCGHLPAKITSAVVRIKKNAAATSAIRMTIYSDNNGVPGTDLVYKELAAGSVSTSYGWITFTLATPYEPTPGAYYWVVLTTADTFGYMWQRSPEYSVTKGGARHLGATGTWLAQKWNAQLRVNWTKTSRSQSFVGPTGGMSCDLAQLYLFDLYTAAGDTFTVSLCADDDGVPGTVLKSKDITGADVPTKWSWVEVEWASAQTLDEGVTYHLVLEPKVVQTGQGFLVWGGNSAGGYGSGSSDMRLDSGSWVAQTEDLYFRANRDNLQGDVIAFARYDGKWYCASGDSVYVWNTGTTAWDSSDQKSGDEVTALEAWGDWLWAARGTEWVLRKFNGTDWVDVSATYAQCLKAGGGYLHYSGAAATHTYDVYYTADGSTWSNAMVCGAGSAAITELAWFRDTLVASTPRGLWGIAAEIPYVLLDWASQEDTENGKGMMTWVRDGSLYVPLRFGLFRYNGDTMVSIGPEGGTGLPVERAGRVVALIGTGNWLFAAIDAGASGTSSILAYNGQGWHELMRAEVLGQRIKAMEFETLSTPNRLWYGLSKETRHLILPDYSDNPWQQGNYGYEYNAGGEIVMSWMGGNLIEVVKDLYEVVIRAENVSSSCRVLVYYEIDRSGSWTLLGEVSGSPRQSLLFEASTFSPKTVGSSSTKTTIELATGESTGDMESGDWCRINAEVSQVASITDSDTFVLETALSTAPSAADVVYASLPAGREFRLKLVLSTTDKTQGPKIKAVVVRFQSNVLDRFIYTLQVNVEDDKNDLAGNPYPHTAADLRVKLDEWARRNLAFTLVDPDGEEHLVKVSSAGEGNWRRKQTMGQSPVYRSQYAMTLVEVG